MCHNFWRPVTAIQGGGNRRQPGHGRRCDLDPIARGTPPIPDHDSAHSVEGGAGAQVLRRFFGTNRISFPDLQLDPAGRKHVQRRVRGVAFVHELRSGGAGERRVRILVGFHFRNAVMRGVRPGRRIGDRAVGLFLRPIG